MLAKILEKRKQEIEDMLRDFLTSDDLIKMITAEKAKHPPRDLQIKDNISLNEFANILQIAYPPLSIKKPEFK
jgi:hypothetical protein